MRKTFLLLIASIMVMQGYAQQGSEARKQQPTQMSTSIKPQKLSGDLVERLYIINSQIDSLKTDIHNEYLEYSKQQLYTNSKFQDNAFLKIKENNDSLRNKVKELEHDIDSLKEENMLMDRIREYYDINSIDSLYIHVDLMTLIMHKKILGSGYPTVIDDLIILFESGDLLKKEYDEKQNFSKKQEIKGIRQCKTKEYLENLLSVQKDITDEVNIWIKDEEHTLYSLVTFRTDLYNNYGIILDIDFPYLSNKVTKEVLLSPNKK